MTDRELLERAARAAGYDVHWSKPDDAYCVSAICVQGYTTGVHWNPLTSDADAFRLMVDWSEGFRRVIKSICYGERWKNLANI